MKVLLLVDVQNDFCPGGSLPVAGGDEIVAVVNKLMREGDYDLVVASLDWHPRDHISFISQHPGAELFQVVSTAHGEQRVWPEHCIQESFGAQLHGDLEVERVHHLVQKGMNSRIDSYSAFFDNGKSAETPLRGILTEAAHARGETLSEVELTVAGLALDVCVAATVRDAVSLKIPTTVVLDGCRAVNTNVESELSLLREFTSMGVKVVLSKDLLPQRARDVERSYQIQP